MEKNLRITKRYGRRISHDYQSWEFLTEISEDVKVSSKEDLIRENDRLFSQVRCLTLKDIESVKQEIGPQKLENK